MHATPLRQSTGSNGRKSASLNCMSESIKINQRALPCRPSHRVSAALRGEGRGQPEEGPPYWASGFMK